MLCARVQNCARYSVEQVPPTLLWLQRQEILFNNAILINVVRACEQVRCYFAFIPIFWFFGGSQSQESFQVMLGIRSVLQVFLALLLAVVLKQNIPLTLMLQSFVQVENWLFLGQGRLFQSLFPVYRGQMSPHLQLACVDGPSPLRSSCQISGLIQFFHLPHVFVLYLPS